ncbi:MAG: phage virion morphogenesis protein [Bacteroidetes bacterium]|nr:phage virion morphogenesis protein [Bacteroidota bacterium]
MEKVNLSDFARKIDALSKTYKTLPKEIGAEAVKFSKERFVSQSWLDKTKENWKPRKRPRKGKGSNTLLVKTGRLKRSVRVISADETQIIVGSDVPYAQIQNDGGTINKSVTVKAHTRKRKTRCDKTTVKAHTRKMNTTIPSRRFLGTSYTLEKRITNLITARFMRALKQ